METNNEHSPDQDTLVLQRLPQRAVALVSHGEDVGADLAQVVAAVQLHGGAVVQAGQRLVGVHRRQDGADVRLRGDKVNQLRLSVTMETEHNRQISDQVYALKKAFC